MTRNETRRRLLCEGMYLDTLRHRRGAAVHRFYRSSYGEDSSASEAMRLPCASGGPMGTVTVHAMKKALRAAQAA